MTRAVGSAVMTVEKRIPATIFTAIDNVVIPIIGMAVKLIAGSTEYGTNSEVHNPDRRVFSGNIRIIPLKSASSRLHLDNESNSNNETRNDEDFEDSDFPASKPTDYDRRAHVHHMVTGVRCHVHHIVTGHNATRNCVSEYLEGRIQTQNNPLP